MTVTNEHNELGHMGSLLPQRARTQQEVRILRIALEAIYTQPYITLAEARQLARQALEDTE